MKKFSKYCFVFLFFLFLSNIASAQLVRFGLGGGLTSLKSPDAFVNSIENNGLGFSNNYHLTAIVKFNFPLIPITPAAFIDYHILRGSGSRNSNNIETSLNIFSIGVEGELIIIPLPLVKPYVAADISYNKFGDLQETSQLGSGSQPGMTRYGGALGVGAEITALPSIDLDLSIKYQLFNLVGKDSNESNINGITLNLILLF
ncbi:MAG: porin family protein [Bacteroidetes bacterium]|nr:porin family protein [Bacteroidota bacterium]